MKQYLLPIIAALLLGACTVDTFTGIKSRQENILGFYGEKAGTGNSTKPQMYIITDKNEYRITLPPIFQAVQQAGIFKDAVHYRLNMWHYSEKHVELEAYYPYSQSREDSLLAFRKQLEARNITDSYTRQYFNVYKTDSGKFIRLSVEANTNWQQVKLENREALLAQYRRAEPIRLGIYENGRTQRSVKPLDGSSIGMLLLSPILVPVILFTGGFKPVR